MHIRKHFKHLWLDFFAETVNSFQPFSIFAKKKKKKSIINVWKSAKYFSEYSLILYPPTPQNVQTHSNNSSDFANELVECVDHFVGLALKGLKHRFISDMLLIHVVKFSERLHLLLAIYSTFIWIRVISIISKMTIFKNVKKDPCLITCNLKVTSATKLFFAIK